MTVEFDDKAGAFRVSHNATVDGKRVRKTKLLPAGLTLEAANHIEKTLIDPDHQLKETVLTAISNVRPDCGAVYILSNEYLPGILKIGFSRNSVYERVRNLSTAYPADFKIVSSMDFHHPATIELVLHRHFHKERVAHNREFFRVGESDARRALDACFEVDGLSLAAAVNAIGRRA